MKHLLYLVLVPLLLPVPGLASTDGVVEVVFDELEKAVIREYYREQHSGGIIEEGEATNDRRGKKKKKDKGKSKDLPPGLAKKDELPPGLSKQLERNGRLPPGLAKRRLPDDLEAKLPAPKAGYERVIVDNDVVLIEKATEVVRDILKDVLRTY